MSLYYDPLKYSAAKAKFEEFLNTKCDVSRLPMQPFSDFNISTITCVFRMCHKVNIKRLFQFAEPNENIVYVETSKLLKGEKRKKRIKPPSTQHRPKRTDQLFTNQMSIGMRCHDPTHNHNNPISIKVFRNGIIQMTGCKSLDEIQIMYFRVLDTIRSLPTEFQLGTEIVKIPIVDEIIPFRQEDIRVEMINGTFYTNTRLDIDAVLNSFLDNYSHNEVFITKQRRSPLNIFIKKFKYYDERKKKDKIPSVFIYNTGSINVIATTKEILYDSYNFIKNHFKTHASTITERKVKIGE